MSDIATECGLAHIAHVRLSSKKSNESTLLASFTTFSREWQARYFLKQYIMIDPVIELGRTAVLPFDWETIERDDPVIREFFADAVRHNVGRNGISIPVRNRQDINSIVSFTSNAPRPEWESFKRRNMAKLQHFAVLIDSATAAGSKLEKPSVRLSLREEQCLIWAAQGKTHEEIADILGLNAANVRSRLDTTRHKLNCLNLRHTVGVAIATGLLPAVALEKLGFPSGEAHGLVDKAPAADDDVDLIGNRIDGP